MSAGGRIFIVVLVLAFVATGLYYLFVSDGGTTETALAPSVSEPPQPAVIETPEPKPAPEPVVQAKPEPTPISTKALSLRIAVSASNPAGVDLPRLRDRLRMGGPDDAGNGIAGWFEVYNPDSFAENDEMRQALLMEPSAYFRDRFSLVVEPHDGILQMMLYTLPSRSIVPSSTRGVDVLAVESKGTAEHRALTIQLDDTTGRRVELLTKPNISRPCAMLVNGKVVMVPRISAPFSTDLVLAGAYDEQQFTAIEDALGGKGTLVAGRLAAPDQGEPETALATSEEPLERGGSSALVLTNPTTVTDAAPAAPVKAAKPVKTTPTVPVKTTDYVVKDGDTLSSIASNWFGSPNDWTLIVQANPKLDPNRLAIGQVLKLPPKDSKPVPAKAAAGEYTVRSGDSLASIARSLYGTDGKWAVLYEANKGVIGDDPANLSVGMRLKVPSLK